jgi:hypothetical protein
VLLLVKCVYTTNIKSCILNVIGNPTIKSIEITSHFNLVSHMVVIILLGVDAQPSLAGIQGI